MFILRKIKKWVILVVIISLLLFGVYKVFIKCNHINTLIDHEFTLEKMDYATIADEDKNLTVKLMGITDERCGEGDCTKNNELVAKIVVLNSNHLSYIKLGDISNKIEKIEKNKMKYNIELINISEDGKVTLKVTK